MLNPDYLPDFVLNDIIQQTGYPDNKAGYSQIAKISPQEAFQHFLEWHGILGYDQLIFKAVEGIQAATIKTNPAS